MSNNHHHSKINIKCIECGFNYRMGFSYFSNSIQIIDSHTNNCPKCNKRFYCEFEYGPQKTTILKLDFPCSKFHKMIWKCSKCNHQSEEKIEWYGKDLEEEANYKCKSCASYTKVAYSVSTEKVRITNSRHTEVINAKWNDYYELVTERDYCFILSESEKEPIGDDQKGFINFLVDEFGIKYEDAGYAGGIVGADRWEEYLPFLDGGYIRMQNSPDNPDISNGLILEGFWIFGIKAFRMLCYIEDLKQPNLMYNENRIPTYIELSKELRNHSKIVDYETSKRILLEKLYGKKN